MIKLIERRTLTTLLASLALFLGGCSSLTTEAKSPLGAAPAGTARVYFALDQGYPAGYAYISEGDNLLGFLTNGEHFVVDLPAGEHLLILKSEQDEALKGNFEAGKTYHVRLFVSVGVMSSRTYWVPLKNSGEDLALREEIIKDTDRVELVPEKEAAWEKEEKEDLLERERSFTSGEDKIEQFIGPEHAL